MFGMISEVQKQEIRTEIEACVERVFQRHGFRPNQSDTAALHNALSTNDSAVVALVGSARLAARTLVNQPEFDNLIAELNGNAERVENLYKNTRKPGV